MFKTPIIFLGLILVSHMSLANPMQPDPVSAPTLVKKATTPAKASLPRLPHLTTIVIVGDLRKAVFNGATEIELGERISRYELVTVTSDYVELKYGNTIKRIRLQTAGEISIAPTKEE